MAETKDGLTGSLKTQIKQIEEQRPMQEIDPVVAEFVVESREHLADVENQLLAIESAGADIDVELVNTVFRAVHSIKGAAGFMIGPQQSCERPAGPTQIRRIRSKLPAIHRVKA